MAPNTTGANLTQAGLRALEQISQPYDTFSEDCLTLNIWTKPQVGEKKKAVMVWIYGGGYSVGSSSDPSYDGQLFAEEQDVVIVSFKSASPFSSFPSFSPFSFSN